MRIGNLKVKRRVWIGALIAVAVTGAWGLWTRARRQVAAVAAPGRAPFVRLAGTGTGGGDRVMRERAELYDPTPLFFPTEWNFGQQPLPASLRRQPGQVFGSFEANYTFPEQNLKAYGTEELAVPEKLSDVLAQGNEDPLPAWDRLTCSDPPWRIGAVSWK